MKKFKKTLIITNKEGDCIDELMINSLCLLLNQSILKFSNVNPIRIGKVIDGQTELYYMIFENGETIITTDGQTYNQTNL